MSYRNARFKRCIYRAPNRFERDLKAQSIRQCMQGQRDYEAAAWWRELRAMRAVDRRGANAPAFPLWIPQIPRR